MTASVGPSAGQFLQDRPTATLGTVRRDGSPQASVVWYLWDGSEFVISTIHRTAKWHNLRRDPRCSICVEDPDSGQMVIAYGRATLHDADVYERTWALVDKYYEDVAETEAHMARIWPAGDRVLIAVAPERVITRRLD